MPYRQNFPIPSVIDPPRTCLCLQIPDSAEWRAVVAGLISELTYWFNYERTGDNSGSQCAAVWKEIYNDIDWSSMSCCCDDIVILFQWTEDGELESSSDGGVTYEPAPEQDPRNNSPVYPPTPGDPSNDKRCIAATGMSLLIKEGIGDQLTEDMGRYTLGQLIKDWVTTVIQTSNPFEALIQIVTNQVFALLISAVIAALTETVYGILQCIFYCRMEDDLTFTDGGWALVRSDILDQIGGVAGLFLEHLVFLLGRVGLTNLARSQAATDGDCSECTECLECSQLWSVFGGAHGTIVASGDDYIDVDASDGGNGNYYVILRTPDSDSCCILTSREVLSGSIDQTGNLSWTDCGQPQVEGAPQHPFGLYGFSTCINYVQLQSSVDFTVRLTFAAC